MLEVSERLWRSMQQSNYEGVPPHSTLPRELATPILAQTTAYVLNPPGLWASGEVDGDDLFSTRCLDRAVTRRIGQKRTMSAPGLGCVKTLWQKH